MTLGRRWGLLLVGTLFLSRGADCYQCDMDMEVTLTPENSAVVVTSNSYRNNEDKCWSASSTAALTAVWLEDYSMDSHDYLIIYDGYPSTGSRIATLTGYLSSSDNGLYWSTVHERVTLRLTSDDSRVSRGFRGCFCYHKAGCENECEELLHGDGGDGGGGGGDFVGTALRILPIGIGAVFMTMAYRYVTNKRLRAMAARRQNVPRSPVGSDDVTIPAPSPPSSNIAPLEPAQSSPEQTSFHQGAYTNPPNDQTGENYHTNYQTGSPTTFQQMAPVDQQYPTPPPGEWSYSYSSDPPPDAPPPAYDQC